MVGGSLDGEPDLFSFNFPGYTGKFYINEDKEAVFIPKQDLKLVIDPLNSTVGDVSLPGFLIITPNGTKYYFGEANRDDGSFVRTLEETTSTGEDDVYKVNSWHLLRIESADDNFAIDFNYEMENYAFKSPASCKRTVIACNGTGLSASSVDISCPVITGYNNLQKYVTTQVRTHKLSSIVTSTKRVDFISSTEREDLDPNTLVSSENSKAERLDAIEINEGNYCHKYSLSYSYFRDQRDNLVMQRSEAKRLKLESIQQTDCNSPAEIEIPPYTFEYYDGITNSDNSQFFPHRLDKAIDHWGYYNGSNSNNNEPVNVPTTTVNTTIGDVTYTTTANREPSEHHMKFGSLIKVNYPTGGFAEYTFEPHSYIGTSEVKEDLLSEGVLKSCVGSYGLNCCNTQTKTSMVASIADVAKTRFDIMIDIDEAMECTFSFNSKVEVQIRDEFGTAVGLPYIFPLADGSNQDDPNSNGRFNLPITDIYQFLTAGNYIFELTSTEAYGRFVLYETEEVNSEMIGGGLRIKNIKSHDGISVGNDVE